MLMIVGLRKEEKRCGSGREHGRSLRAMISSLCAFTLGKSCLTNLFAFCVGTTSSVSGRREVGVIYVDFSLQHVVLWHHLCYLVWNAVA